MKLQQFIDDLLFAKTWADEYRYRRKIGTMTLDWIDYLSAIYILPLYIIYGIYYIIKDKILGIEEK